MSLLEVISEINRIPLEAFRCLFGVYHVIHLTSQ